ncbi:uncharacterized protein Patronin isoform X6 [Cherax quadricarinatus]|uniref:uncharacterized protein Patronin isoform X6 n=1 Tax=Cherax quadricarinatus TaxID=27406 RepID=UPI0023798F41|nr:uncharacterized protein LOC128701611 isoform X6 [Cherax quadricarinatus]
MRDFLRKSPSRGSVGSSLSGCKRPTSPPAGEQASHGKDSSGVGKFASAFKMRAFRGSVRKKIAELEASAKDDVNKVTPKTLQSQSAIANCHMPDPMPIHHEDADTDTKDTVEEREEIQQLENTNHENTTGKDEVEVPRDEDHTESEAESVYESRKLMLRRVMHHEAKEAKQSHCDHSDADSWTDLEENFAKIYEPIPYRVRKEAWHKMTKEELLHNINSERMRSRLKNKSRKEILQEIDHLRAHPVHFKQHYRNFKSPKETLGSGERHSASTTRQHQVVVAEVHSPPRPACQTLLSDTDSEFGETDYVTRSELYRNIQNLQNSLARHNDLLVDEDSQSWKSLPSQPDDTVYISRSDILSKVDPTYASRSEVAREMNDSRENYVSRSEILTRLQEMQESEDERDYSPTHTTDSNWDLCSCVSCEQCGTEVSSASEAECHCSAKQAGGKTHEEHISPHRPSSPGDRSLLSQDSWSNGEFEKIYEPMNRASVDLRQDYLVSRTLEEQEKRLRKLAHVEEHCSSAGRGKYLPVDTWSISGSEDVYEPMAHVARASLRGAPSSSASSNKMQQETSGSGDLELQRRVREIIDGQKQINTTTRNKVVQAITEHIQHLHLDNILDEEERNHEIRERLKEAMAQDWETLSNINLGHIYVPMEESSKSSKLGSRENTDYDTFGSIDSLIFEPKVPAIKEALDETAVSNVVSSTDSLLDKVLEQKHDTGTGDSALSAMKLLDDTLREEEGKNKDFEERSDEDAEETPVPTPTPSTLVESEQELPIYDTDEDPQEHPVNDIQNISKENPLNLKQHPWPWSAGNLDHRGNIQPNKEPTKLPLKQKIYNGLMGLGFIRFGSKENLKSSVLPIVRDDSTLDICGNNTSMPEVSHKVPVMKLQRGLDSRKDLHGYQSFKVDFQRLSGKRLPSEEDSTYDYHPDHNEALYHGGTTTSHDTADSETDSVASLESVIFKGNLAEKEDASDLEDKKKKKNLFRHKFVVNQGNESDNSELVENKSMSTHPYLDSDTSWDYMEAVDEEKVAMQRYAATLKAQADMALATPGPRVVGNMRRKSLHQTDSMECSPAALPPEGVKSSDCSLQTGTGEALQNVEDRRDGVSPSSPMTRQLAPLRVTSPTEYTDEEIDGRQLFRAYQQRQLRLPSDLERRDGGGSTSTTTHEYQDTEEDVYEVCDSSGCLVQRGQDNPTVVLLKHHVYQSIESLASRSCISSTPSIKSPVTEGTLDDGELQLYGSRHGEPIYGARNSLLFHSMNGAFVSRSSDDSASNPPVIIRKGRVVELTEEMFKGTLDRNVSLQQLDSQQNMTFHSSLLPSPMHEEDRLYFQNTVSSTESREVHSYENDSEIYGTRKEISEEILRTSREQQESEPQVKILVDERSSADPPTLLGGSENTEVREGTSTAKIKRVQKLGVSIMGNNNDMMIRELKLKLKCRFNQDDESEGSQHNEKLPAIKPEAASKGPLTATISSDSINSVALKREQLAPHMNKIFGSLYEMRRQSIESEVSEKEEVTGVKSECGEPSQAKADVKDTKEEKQEKNEKEKGKDREVITVTRADGGVDQVCLPTPDYTPASTLPRDNLNSTIMALDHLMDHQLAQGEDYSFDLADLAKYVHEHISKNKNLYSDPGGFDVSSTPVAQVSAPVSPSPIKDAIDPDTDLGFSKRSVHFDMSKNLGDLSATWSDIESVIFAEDKSASEYMDWAKKQGDNGEYVGSVLSSGKLPVSRMESYRDSDYLLWEQLAKMRRSNVPEDRERWQLEKTKRMLLWIHLSNDNTYTEWCYKSQWWKAKQRASVAWIVQKAHKNKVPSDLHDPYYRDYEGAEHLKPGIVHRLANADLYCSALANIYGDPNFHNLSHWNIIQALARKGVYVAEPTDVALTETVLIQVSPIKMSAHLAVIEAMMALYIREVVVADRAVAVLQRVGGGMMPERIPQDQEEALVVWISHVTQALQERIHQQVQSQDQELPVFPRIQDLSDLSDGIGLAALISFYCPQELPWGDIAVADPPSIADSLYNIGLVIRFCQESLPYNPCLLTKEDIVYMHSSVKQNVLAFAAELFFLLELEPVSCVSLPGTKKTSTKFIQLSSPGGGGCSGWSGYQRSMKVIPDLRASLSPSSAHSTASYSSARSSSHSQQRSPYSTLRGRGGGKSPSSGGSGSGSGTGTGTGLRRQQSLTERDRLRRDRVSVHEAQTCQPTRQEQAPASGPSFGRGYPQGLGYNIPVRDVPLYHHPPSHGLSHERVRARASHPAHLQDYGMKPAGAPSVRRSHSMNLNDMADIRSRIEQRTERSENAPSSYNSDYGGRDSSMSDGQEGDFVVQRSRGLATLSDMMRTQSPRPSQELETSYSSRSTTKEKYNMDSKEEELGERSRGLGRRGSFNNSHPDLPAAGMPSRYEERPHGRSRSRRNSISAEDSQLTIENFGGSQDNLNYISRNPDKEPFVHTGRRESSNVEGSQLRDSREGSARPESRNSRDRSIERRLDLHRGSIEELDNRLVDKLEREALEREKRDSSQYTSKERLIVRDPRKISVEAVDSGSESDASFDREKQMVKATSFAELSKLKEQLPGGINIIYMQSDKDDSSRRSSKSSEKKTTFAALPNQTTWKQQSAQSHSDDNKSISDENMEPQVMASELHNVRLKLEEKRRRIEAEKRKMEQAMNKQRQKLGKEAFMQAVVKGGKGSSTGSSTPTTSEPDALDTMVDSVEQCLPKHPSSLTTTATPPNPDLSLKDIGTDVTSLSRRWLEGENQAEELRTPDLDTMDYDQYHQSLTHGESGLEGSRRSSLDHPHAVQLRRRTYVGRDPRERASRDPRVDLRRMSLYLEPGTWRSANDSGTLPPTPPRRISMGPDSFTPPYRMTDSLTEIQSDIQRLSHQQQQIQSLMHNGMNPPSNQAIHQAPAHGQFYLHDQQGSPVRRMWGQQPGSDGYASMSPATRRAQWGPARPMMPQSDYMMAGQHPNYYPGYQMSHPAQMPPLSQVNTQPQMGSTGQGFMLHGQPQSLPPQAMYQNGQGFYSPEHQFRGYPPNAQTYGSSDHQRQMGQTPPFRLHGEGTGGDGWGPGADSRGPGSLRSSAQSSPSRQPPQRQQKSPSPTRQTSVSHAPVAAPPPDDMEPQSVSFINSTDEQHSENQKDDASDKLKRLSISSGSKTYRISHEPGSPTRPSLGVKTFRVPTKKGTPIYDDVDLPQPAPPQRSRTPPYHQDTGGLDDDDEDDDEIDIKAEPLQEGPKGDKGFYISFESNSGPRKPKPQLRNKKMSRKNSSPSTPATTPSREDLPVVPIRPSRTSNGSFDPQSGSMTQTLSPSMAKSPFTLSSLQSSSKRGYPSPQINGLSHNSPSETEQEEHEPCPEIHPDEMAPFSSKNQLAEPTAGMAIVIADDLTNSENSSASEMEKKKEKLMMMSMKRKQEQEEARLRKEMEAQAKREAEKLKEEEKLQKKEEEKARRQMILERYKIKKAMEEAEKEGRYYEPPPGLSPDPPSSSHGKPSVRLRNKPPGGSRPRPKTMAGSSVSDTTDGELTPSRGKKGSSQNIAGDYPSTTRTLDRGHTGRRPTSVIGYSSITRGDGRKTSLYGSQGDGLNYGEDYRVHEARRPSLALEGSGSRLRRGSASSYNNVGSSGGYKKYRSTGNLSGQSEHDSLVYHMSEDSGLGRATPPRRAPSPGMARHLPSPSGPGSLPPGLFSKRRQGGFDDAASDISSTASSTMDYYGPKLFKQPTAKSNRTIILNAVEYCVFPGMVNQTAKHRVLEEIARSESKHFLVLFRDSGCQFRAIYSFNPETEEVCKLYGTGPKQVNDRMFDKFFKYNSGGKCFSQIHTKHLTVTIDAFTIHNSLWQGKRVNLPSKKDMTLVI